MKQLFFFTMLLVLPATILVALLYSFGKYLFTLYEDRRELKELDAIQAETAARRERNREDSTQRLNNGCQHAFDTGLGFPPGVCPKCGIANQKPLGECDHVWRRVESSAAASACVKCGKAYRTEF
jgi:hypothetical protein